MSLKTFLKPKIKSFMKKTFIIKMISFFIFIYSRLIGLTTRWHIDNSSQIQKQLSQPSILVGWHARTVMLPFFWHKLANQKLNALVSPHQDGQLIAHFLKLYDINPISGSTNEKASQSALEIMRLLEKKQSIFISPDGPRGPRMRMKKSPIYFASKSGFPIIFATFSTSHALFFNKAWDKTLFPLPFGKGVFTLSKPLYIPSNINDEQLETYRLQLEDLANSINSSCDTQVGQIPVQPADPDEIKKKRY